MGAEDMNSEHNTEGRYDLSLEPLLPGADEAATQKDEIKKREVTHVGIMVVGTDPIGFTFNGGWRPYRDTTFAFLFLATLVATYTLGIFVLKHSNPDLVSRSRVARFDPKSGQCRVPEHVYVGTAPTHFTLSHGRKTSEEIHDSFDSTLFYGPVAATGIVSLPMGLFLMWLLHKYTRRIVFVALPLAVMFPFAVNASWYAYCKNSEGHCHLSEGSLQTMFIIFSIFGIFYAFWLYSQRGGIELTIQVLKTGTQALKQNLSLVIAFPLVWFGTLIVNGPIIVFILHAFWNGEIAPDFDKVNNPSHHCGLAGGEYCCKFKPAGWVTPYVTLAGLAIMWTTMVALQLQLFTISGTVAQWYFAPAGSSTMGTTKRSLRNAFGPSFGTVCLAGLINTLMRVLRSLAHHTRNNNHLGIFSIIIRACIISILRFVEFLTNFTSNFAAITGNGFCTSATMTYELLRRNWLSTLVVEILANRVLTMISCTFVLIYSLMVFGMMELFTNASRRLSMGTAGVCLVVALVVLELFNQVLRTVIDTVYICYAMDKDAGREVSKPEVHDVYVLLPVSADGEETRLAMRQSNES